MTKRQPLVLALCLFALVPFRGSAQRTSAARILPLGTSQWTADDRGILGSMERGDQTIDVFKTCLRHTELCRNWMPFTRYVLGTKSTLPPRDRELLILRTSALSRADYDWGHDVPAAKRAGLTDDEIARIAKGPELAAGARSTPRCCERPTNCIAISSSPTRRGPRWRRPTTSGS